MRLQQFFAPDKSTVLSLACTPQSLYAGLVNGAVAVYGKAEGSGVCTSLLPGASRDSLSLGRRRAVREGRRMLGGCWEDRTGGWGRTGWGDGAGGRCPV